jgi:hypothetical protein
MGLASVGPRAWDTAGVSVGYPTLTLVVDTNVDTGKLGGEEERGIIADTMGRGAAGVSSVGLRAVGCGRA